MKARKKRASQKNFKRLITTLAIIICLNINAVASADLLISETEIPAPALDVGILDIMEESEINGSGDSTIIGRIAPTIMYVEGLITPIPFQVDLMKNLSEAPFNQAINAEDRHLTITNHGVAIDILVEGIESESEIVYRKITTQHGIQLGEGFPVTFTGSFEEMENLELNRAGIMIALGNTQNFPSEPDNENVKKFYEDMALYKGRFESGNPLKIATLENNESITINVYCYVRTNAVIGAFDFSITPKIKYVFSEWIDEYVTP